MNATKSTLMDGPAAGDEAYATRAAAHACDPLALRAAQRFQNQVTDLDVARVFLALERGTQPIRNSAGRWLVAQGVPLNGMHSSKLSVVINEMIRTGLVRHYRDNVGDHLLPAPVHMRNADDPTVSACLFVGENMGPMRSRVVDRLDLVDCLACEQAIATGTVRGL
jgi:hypothetical protein